jgi:hypothetical protein
MAFTRRQYKPVYPRKYVKLCRLWRTAVCDILSKNDTTTGEAAMKDIMDRMNGIFKKPALELETLAHKIKMLTRGEKPDFNMEGDDEIARLYRAISELAGELHRTQAGLSKALIAVDEAVAAAAKHEENKKAAEENDAKQQEKIAALQAEIQALTAKIAQPPPPPPPHDPWELRARLLTLQIAIADLNTREIERAAAALIKFNNHEAHARALCNIIENAESGLYREAADEIAKLLR